MNNRPMEGVQGNETMIARKRYYISDKLYS